MMDADDLDKSVMASRYLESVSKGVNALELSNAIMELPDAEKESEDNTMMRTF